jgi:propanediol utilization protein
MIFVSDAALERRNGEGFPTALLLSETNEIVATKGVYVYHPPRHFKAQHWRASTREVVTGQVVACDF